VERTSSNEIKLFCQNEVCKEPVIIPEMIESCLKYVSFIVCEKCDHRLSDLTKLIQFSYQTRVYKHL